MEFQLQIEKNIVKEIVRECSSKKLKPKENFLNYIVNLLLLDPKWGITEDVMNIRQNVQNFIRFVIKELENSNSSRLITFQMQFSYECNLEKIDTYVLLFRQRLAKTLSPLHLDISNVKELHDKVDINALSKKITYYIVLLSGLGKPTDDLVYLEAYTALKSIMDDDELRDFVKLDEYEKEKELEHLSKLVVGIRLFNKDCQINTFGIPDVPMELKKAATRLRERMKDGLVKIMKSVNAVTKFVDNCCKVVLLHGITSHLEVALPEEIETGLFDDAQDVLILFRQHELIIRKLLDKVTEVEQRSEELMISFDRLLKKIHKTVYMKIAISVTIVFPLFESLANLWAALQNQIVYLAVYQKILNYLEEFSAKVPETKRGWRVISNIRTTLMDETKCFDLATIASRNPKIQVISYATYQESDDINLEYRGFCPWKLIKSKGALLPGNPCLGVYMFKNKYFVFSCLEAADAFCTNPQEIHLQVLALVRRKPQLINFLELKDDLIKVKNTQELVHPQKVQKKTKDKMVQSVDSYDQLVPPYKDPTYRWNIWDLKREALQLATLTKCVSKSVQTVKSFSSNTAITQTYNSQNRNIQTNSDKYTDFPKPKVFLYGLRGRKDDKQFCLNITTPSEEPKCF